LSVLFYITLWKIVGDESKWKSKYIITFMKTKSRNMKIIHQGVSERERDGQQWKLISLNGRYHKNLTRNCSEETGEKHIFMFVCWNEKLENHSWTINCVHGGTLGDDFKMTIQIFSTSFSSTPSFYSLSFCASKILLLLLLLIFG
jgi:hypothetical protein